MNAEFRTAELLASQRVRAEGRLTIVQAEGRTRLAELYQEGAAKIRLPKHDGDGIEAVLINTAGGLTGGDRLAWRIGVGENAALTLSTQACEKIYRSAGGAAQVSTAVSVGSGGWLAWLPQETILFNRAALDRTLDIELGHGAEALLVEPVLIGRTAHGETVTRAHLADRWRVRQGGRLVHAEALRLGPDVSRRLAAGAGTNGARALATVMLAGPRGEGLLKEARTIVGDEGGASFWRVAETGKLLARIVSEDGYALRRRLVPLISLLSGQAALPKSWSL